MEIHLDSGIKFAKPEHNGCLITMVREMPQEAKTQQVTFLTHLILECCAASQWPSPIIHPFNPLTVCLVVYLMLMATPTPPAILVTLKTRVVDMAHELGSLTHFLEAAQALQTCNSVSSESFQKNSRKVRHSPSLASIVPF